MQQRFLSIPTAPYQAKHPVAWRKALNGYANRLYFPCQF
jgi:hypothetical protein